jgi:tetratricopeptide (TPR) repeat protein/ribosomal protein L40E
MPTPAPVPSVSPTSPSGVVCGKCGAVMPADARFCGGCGGRIEGETAASAPARAEAAPPSRSTPVQLLLVAWGVGLLGGFFLGRAFAPGISGKTPAGQEAAEAPEDATHFLVRARAAFDAKRWDSARDLYERALSLSPDDQSARVDLGITLVALGDDAGARREFEAALKGRTPHPAAAYNLARLAEKAGNRKDAAKYYAIYLRLAPNGPRAAEVRAKTAARGGNTAP